MKKLTILMITSIPIIAAIFLIGTIKVKAATTTAWSTAQVKVGTCHDDTCSYGSNYDTPKTFSSTDLTYPVYSLRWRVRASNGLSSENTYTFTVGYQATPDSLGFKEIYLKGNGDVSRENALCERGVDSSNYIVYKCTFTPLEDYGSSDYLYITIDFYQGYVTGLKAKISNYEERMGTNAVITQQTNNIIENNNENTQEIINNITQANQTLIQSLQEQGQVCEYIEKSKCSVHNKYLNLSGNEQEENGFCITDYINILKSKIKIAQSYSINNNASYCFYNANKELIICSRLYTLNNEITIPSNAEYMRTTIAETNNKPQFYICKDGNQAILDASTQYNNTMTDQTEVDSMQQAEEDLLEYIGYESPENILNIVINPTVASFIWEIVNRIRTSSTLITMFFTSILSLGVIKMVLNR